MNLSEIEKKIIQILEKEIKPNIVLDGGDVKYCSFKDGVVTVELCGACSGCPNALNTLKFYIERALQYYIPEVVTVEAMNFKI